MTAAALALPASAGATDVASKTLHQSPADVRAYWTPERMANARPASELLRHVSPEALPPVPDERGKPWSVSGSTPDRHAGAVDDLLGAPSRRATRIGDPSQAPFRTHGKVFLTFGGFDYVCSGTVVPAKHKRLVATAGHCAYDGGFARNWIFVPGKDGGSEPYGRWTAVRLATTSRWANSTEDANPANDDVRYDVAFAKMRKRNGRRLQKVVGARGIAFSQSRNLLFNAFGYPAQDPYSGSELYLCSSMGEGTDSEVSPPRPTRIDCDMTGGSSGGGWVIGRGRVNSVTSYAYEAVVDCPLLCEDPDGEKLYGPYFGETIRALYKSQRRKRSR